MNLKASSALHRASIPTVRAQALNNIIRSYREMYSELEADGAVPYRLTKLGAWAASRAPHVFYFFKIIELDRYDLFLDLGSGDGIVACIASLFTHAVGIEVDPNLCMTARRLARVLALDRRVDFVCGDYRTQRIQSADCVYMYPDKPIYPVEALLSKWNGTLMIYGPHFPPSHLVSSGRLDCGKESMTLYKAPNNHCAPAELLSVL